MLAEDADVTDKFLHVIRQRRKEKYGKKLYGSDETDQVIVTIILSSF